MFIREEVIKPLQKTYLTTQFFYDFFMNFFLSISVECIFNGGTESLRFHSKLNLCIEDEQKSCGFEMT